jgi:hypothetical protein
MKEKNRWNLLEDWLLRDWWSPIEACHIFAGLVRTEMGGYYARAILLEHRRSPDPDLKNKMRGRAEAYFKIWSRSIHKPDEGEYYLSGRINEFYTKEYCVKWAQKKMIKIPWLDWALEEQFINLEAQKPENQINTKSVISYESDQTAENRLVLIALMAAMLRDKKLKPHLPFDNQSRLGDYIENNYREKYPQKGLSASKIKKILAQANDVLRRAKDEC